LSEQKIYITDFDLKRLKKLLGSSRPSGERKNPYLEELKKEVEKAVVVPSKEIPRDVITMNSTVSLVDLDSGKEYEYTLVFPENADSTTGKISILAPVGTAMLGYRVGDVIEWVVPAGKRRLKVGKVLYQPEASGNYDL
jgi:regulator of nucleoside diphosphate kinase